MILPLITYAKIWEDRTGMSIEGQNSPLLQEVNFETEGSRVRVIPNFSSNVKSHASYNPMLLPDLWIMKLGAFFLG